MEGANRGASLSQLTSETEVEKMTQGDFRVAGMYSRRRPCWYSKKRKESKEKIEIGKHSHSSAGQTGLPRTEKKRLGCPRRTSIVLTRLKRGESEGFKV